MGRKRSPGLRNRGGIWHIEKQILGHKIHESTGTSDLETADLILARRIEEIIEGKRAITADMALRLGLFFNMSAGFWLNLQKDYELRFAKRENLAEFKKVVQPYHAASA